MREIKYLARQGEIMNLKKDDESIEKTSGAEHSHEQRLRSV